MKSSRSLQIVEDDEFMPHGNTHGNGRAVATFDDYVHAQKCRSQKWKSGTNDGGGGVVCTEEMPIDGGGVGGDALPKRSG